MYSVIDGAPIGYADDVDRHPILNRNEFNELAKKASLDREAHEELVRGSLRTILLSARKYRGYGVDFADLIGEGNLAFVEWLGLPEKPDSPYDHAIAFVDRRMKDAVLEQRDELRLTTRSYSPPRVIPSPLEALYKAEYDMGVKSSLRCLTKRERYVVKSIWGIDSYVWSYGDVAKQLGVSRKTVVSTFIRGVKKIEAWVARNRSKDL